MLTRPQEAGSEGGKLGWRSPKRGREEGRGGGCKDREGPRCGWVLRWGVKQLLG